MSANPHRLVMIGWNVNPEATHRHTVCVLDLANIGHASLVTCEDFKDCIKAVADALGVHSQLTDPSHPSEWTERLRTEFPTAASIEDARVAAVFSKQFSAKTEAALLEVYHELSRALAEFPRRFASWHEAHSTILEEFKEFETWVFRNARIRQYMPMRQELIQLAAMAIRAAIEMENRTD